MSPGGETPESRRWGGLLRHRDFRLLWIGETVSQTGGFLATVLVPLLAVTVLRASTFDVAALTAAAWLPWLLIGLPAGALLAGALGTVLGVRNALWVSLSAYALTGAVLCVPSIQAARDLPSSAGITGLCPGRRTAQ